MTDVRATFLATVDVAVSLVHDTALDVHWAEPSALEGYDCGALAGHLLRGLRTVDTYLDDLVPDATSVVDPVTYFVTALGDADPHTSDMHVNVRIRSAELADGGPDALRARAVALRDRLQVRLPAAPRDACIRVFDGMVMRVDDYLDTRLVELTVHTDDLAVSIDVPTPALPDDATRRAVALCAELARRRRGDVALLRALTRTERAPASISAF